MIKKIKRAINNPELLNDWLKREYSTLLYCSIPNTSIAAKSRRIAIMVNNKCNLRCIMCDIGQQKKGEFYKNIIDGGDLSLIVLKKLIDDVRSTKPVIAINGIEPLLYKNIVPFIKYILDAKLRCELTTNGYLLEKFASDFVEMGLPLINISIDGPAEVHNKIRGVSDSFERAYKGIENIIEIKKELNKPLPKIYVAYTISNYNAYYLNETAEIFKNLAVDGIKFTHLNFVDKNMAKAHNEDFGYICKISPSSIGVVTPNDIDEFALAEEIKKIKSSYPDDFIHFSPDITTSGEIKRYYRHPEIFIGKKQCLTPWMNAQILSNGDVIPASRCFHIVLGNIHEKKFRDIWKGATYRKFRKELREIGATPACSRCCGIF